MIFNKEHFSFTKLLPTVKDPMVFVVSQWQLDKSRPGLLYLVYRLVPVSFFVATWFLRLGAPSWPIYLSMWGYTLCTLQSTIGFLMSLLTVVTMTLLKKDDIGRSILKVYPLYWVINVISTTMGFVISTVHWAILAKDDEFTIMDFFIHGINSIYLTIDLCLAGHPVRLIHAVYPMVFALVYVIFGVWYHFYDEDRGGDGYIYYIIDWSYPFSTSFIVLAIGIVIIFFHLITFAIYLCKIRVYCGIFYKRRPSTDVIESESCAVS